MRVRNEIGLSLRVCSRLFAGLLVQVVVQVTRQLEFANRVKDPGSRLTLIARVDGISAITFRLQRRAPCRVLR